MIVKPETLKLYVGAYKGDGVIDELGVVDKEGKLQVEFAGRTIPLEPIAANTFKPVGQDDPSITFERDGDKVAGLTWKVAANTYKLHRVGDYQPRSALPKPEHVEDPANRVQTPLNWPSFRGPNASGNGDTQFPPTTWDVDKGVNVVWKTPIPGLGHSCPIVWEDRVYLTTAVSEDPKATFKPGQYGDVGSVNEKSVHSWRVYCLDSAAARFCGNALLAKGCRKSSGT